MKPPVGRVGKPEGKLIVLQIVLSDIDIIPILRAVVPGAGLFGARRPLLFLRVMTPEISGLNQLFPDLVQVRLTLRLVEESPDGLQLIHIRLRLGDQLIQRLIGTLELLVFIIIALRILRGRLVRVKRDLHL